MLFRFTNVEEINLDNSRELLELINKSFFLIKVMSEKKKQNLNFLETTKLFYSLNSSKTHQSF